MNAFETGGLFVTPERGIRFEVGMASIPSEAHPECPEDAMFADPFTKSFGMFDGKSGSGQGQAAALLTRDFFHERLSSMPDIEDGDLSGAIKYLKSSIEDAGELLKTKMTRGDTTATFFRIFGEDAVFGHTGDSRLYGFRNGLIKPLTIDHGVLMSVKSSFRNKIARKFGQVRFIEDLSTEENIPIEAFEDDSIEIRNSHRDGINFKPDWVSELELYHARDEVLGSLRKNLSPQVGTFRLDSFSHILLTSDGIHDNLTDQQIIDKIKAHESDPRAIAEALSKEASRMSNLLLIPDANGEMKLNVRAKRDDMSAVVVKLH